VRSVWRTPVLNAISRLIGERGWSDGELAARAGLARMRVNRIKNRRARPTVAEALRIGAALELRVEEVFRLDDAAREADEIGS
jgi:putative transcriptional regulator